MTVHSSTASKSRDGWLAALLVAVTLVSYGPALRAGLVWNDSEYVTRPELQSLRGLWRIWFEVGATEQYYPVLHSSFWFQHLLWGDAPSAYHLANVLLHAGCALCLVAVLRKLALPGAWLAAFIFALHPVAVESVAWISEQKNTLSLLFFLLSAWFYLRFDEERRGRVYAVALGFFLLALLSKSVTATLPAALLVVAWWRRGRLDLKREVLPLAPWLILGAAMGLFSGWVEKTYLGAVGSDFSLSAGQRLILSGRIVWFYLGKLLWPADLVFMYPRWKLEEASVGWWLYPALVVMALVILWGWRRRSRGPLAVALLFGGTLFPVLGFFNVFGFLYSYVADHWVYLSSLAVIVGAVAMVSTWAATTPVWVRRGVAVGLVIVLSTLTWRQTRMYRDLETLYRETIARNPAAWMAHNNLGTLLLERGQRTEAMEAFQRTIELKPTAAKAHGNLANLLRDQRRWPEALMHYEESIRLDPAFANTRNNYATALRDTGRLADALVQYAEAIRLDPSSPDARNNYGIALRTAGRLDEAIQQAREAVRLDSNSAPALLNLALSLSLAGKKDEAMARYREARRLNPALPDISF